MTADEVKGRVIQSICQLKGVGMDEIHRQTQRLRRRAPFVEQHLRAVGNHHFMPQARIPQRHLSGAAADVQNAQRRAGEQRRQVALQHGEADAAFRRRVNIFQENRADAVKIRHRGAPAKTSHRRS